MNPEAAYGFSFDNGEPLFLFGDTLYNLFGMAHCGLDVDGLLRLRRSQGVNYVRARLQVSRYLPPSTHNSWQTKDCWPWGGSSQWPELMQLNVDYFKSVDRVVALASELQMGFEMILQGWLNEFPFNDRSRFLAEYEAYWHEYIIARYSAYDSVYIWCPANEYEYFPLGLPVRYNKESNRWLMRISRQIRDFDPHAHPIGAHNFEQKLSLYERLGHCDTVDVYLVQINWVGQIEGHGDRLPNSLCIGLESDMRHHSGNRSRVAICDEFGYEATDGLVTIGIHQAVRHGHTRRGQWRAGFSGFTIVHGFDSTWGPHFRLDKEPQGTGYLLPYYRFMTETLRFNRLQPSPEALLAASGSEERGSLPLCVTDRESGTTAVYFPTRGSCELRGEHTADASYRWFNPRSGQMGESASCAGNVFVSPAGDTYDGVDRDDDWVLLVERTVG